MEALRSQYFYYTCFPQAKKNYYKQNYTVPRHDISLVYITPYQIGEKLKFIIINRITYHTHHHSSNIELVPQFE
jgi:hypothetical protein